MPHFLFFKSRVVWQWLSEESLVLGLGRVWWEELTLWLTQLRGLNPWPHSCLGLTVAAGGTAQSQER